jgi:hypothetical protein
MTSVYIDKAEVEDLPVSTHTAVLGVDIAMHPQADRAAQRGLETRGGLGPEPETEAPTDFRSRHGGIRRGLAAWARRNLFDGAEPGDTP